MGIKVIVLAIFDNLNCPSQLWVWRMNLQRGNHWYLYIGKGSLFDNFVIKNYHRTKVRRPADRGNNGLVIKHPLFTI